MSRLILVVDDEELLLELTSSLLEDIGCKVRTATGGAAALATLAAEPSIVMMITDVQMPLMNGYELAERAHALRPDLRIVLMSGNDQGREGYTFLRKPFQETQLSGIVQSIVGDNVVGATTR